MIVDERLVTYINSLDRGNTEILDIIENNKLDILELIVSEYKISITFKDIIKDEILNEIHKKLITNK